MLARVRLQSRGGYKGPRTKNENVDVRGEDLSANNTNVSSGISNAVVPGIGENLLPLDSGTNRF